jgi:hypothetical protein
VPVSPRPYKQKCRNCGDDELAVHDSNLVFAGTLGNWKCRNCGDDELASSNTDNKIDAAARAKAHKAWEDLFLSRLLSDPQGEFKSAERCTIEMSRAGESDNQKLA